MQKLQHTEPSYPVDDFGLKGADNAAVVQDWMFLIQVLKSRSCLVGKEEHMVTAGQLAVEDERQVCCGFVFVRGVARQPLGGN